MNDLDEARGIILITLQSKVKAGEMLYTINDSQDLSCKWLGRTECGPNLKYSILFQTLHFDHLPQNYQK